MLQTFDLLCNGALVTLKIFSFCKLVSGKQKDVLHTQHSVTDISLVGLECCSYDDQRNVQEWRAFLMIFFDWIN